MIIIKQFCALASISPAPEFYDISKIMFSFNSVFVKCFFNNVAAGVTGQRDDEDVREHAVIEEKQGKSTSIELKIYACH